MKKKIIALSGVSAAAVLALASCGAKTVTKITFEDETYTWTSLTNDVNYDELTNSDLDIYINYDGESGITFRGTSWNNSIDGKTYTQGSLLPTWQRLAELTKTNVREACGYKSTTNDNAYTAIATAGYHSETDSSQMIDLFYNSTSNLKKAGNGGQLLDLYPYIYPNGKTTTKATSKMPYLFEYLENNPAIASAITTNGHIYFTPYLDGKDDVEQSLIMDTEMVKKVLSAKDQGDENKNGTGADSNALQAAQYKPFIEQLSYSVDYVDSTGAKATKTVSSTKNIISMQNELLNQGCSGKELANQLIDYLSSKYSGMYTNLADVYVSEHAVYNVDELVALMRVIKANPLLLTGNANAEIEVFFPRGETSTAIESVCDLVQLWGVQGVDGENENYYFAGDGTLNSLETSTASYEALKYVSQLYDEGLILENFYVASSTKTSSRYLEKYYKKTVDKNSYGFMMYDDLSVVASANDESEGNGTSKRAEGLENYSAKGITAVLPPVTYWSVDGNNAKTSIETKTGKTLTRYYESNRSLQNTSWAVPLGSDNYDAAIRMMDVMYSKLGNLIQNYGPEAYWKNKDQVVTDLVTGEENAVLSVNTKVELKDANTDFWSFMRGYLGAAHGIGYARLQGLNKQAINKYGRTGLDAIEKAINAGVLIHATNASTYKFGVSVPVSFSTSVSDDNARWDGITGFWSADKVNKKEGWVYVVVAASTASEDTYVVKESKNGKAITYKDMLNQQEARDKNCLFVLANSLGSSVVPSYLK